MQISKQSTQNLYHKKCLQPCNYNIAQDEGPVMKINDIQGWIRGKYMNTTGNLGREPRTIHGYRKIPYAKKGVARFQVTMLGSPLYGCAVQPHALKG